MIRLLLLFVILSLTSLGQEKARKRQFYVDTSINLYAFVGEQISLLEFDPNLDNKKSEKLEIDSTTGDTIVRRRYVMDYAFEAKYRIVQPVFNDLKTDTVAFRAYDHYGRPAFENHPLVLLYISRSKDGSYYFHQKYQFDLVRKGKNGSLIGENGKSLQELFNLKKKTIFKERGLFKP